MTIKYESICERTGIRREVTRGQAVELFGLEGVEQAENGQAILGESHFLQATKMIGATESRTSSALMHLASAINHADSARRAVPEVPGYPDTPAGRARQDAAYWLSSAGRDLGKAYDCLRTLAEIINADRKGRTA